jgi:hypothetical protein
MRRYPVLLLALLIIAVLACTEEQPPGEKEEAIEARGDYVAVEKLEDLKSLAGKKVCITGTISSEPWQHLMASPDSFPISTYFDMAEMQTVVYSAEKLACPNCACEIEIKGTVLKVQGKGKGSKADEDYVEYHIVADSWRCLDEKKETNGGE